MSANKKDDVHIDGANVATNNTTNKTSTCNTCKNVIFTCLKRPVEKKNINNWICRDFLLNANNHIAIVNMLYLNEGFDGDKTARKELIKKLNGYKQQDKKKNKFNMQNIISVENTLEKLILSKLKCYYCKQVVLFLYENSRECKQWTLDRLDNRLGHTQNNVVICCLKCNLERRCLNDDKFLFSKQMRLIKKI